MNADGNRCNLKELWLVGESLPLTKIGDPKAAFKSIKLPPKLVALDPRHGVFPNLVMKPLLAAVYSLAKEGDDLDVIEFFTRLDPILQDETCRRFNVFKDRIPTPIGPDKKRLHKASEDEFIVDQDVIESKLESPIPENALWLVFGHQTNFGLLAWLLKNREQSIFKRSEIVSFSEEFIRQVFKVDPSFNGVRPNSLSGRVGVLNRLCTGITTETILGSVLDGLPRCDCDDVTTVLEIFRSIVPLLHNEGYQDGSQAIGNKQNHFVRFAKGNNQNGDLYWQVMGYAIAKRMKNEFVE